MTIFEATFQERSMPPSMKGAIVGDKNLDFFDAVTTFRHREATQLHDKVYGVTGLSNVPTESVDYSIPAAECYTNFALNAIQKTGELDIFAHLYTTEDRERSTLRWTSNPLTLPS